MSPRHPSDQPMILDNASERSASSSAPNSIVGAEVVSALLSVETYLNPHAFPRDEPTITALRQQLAAGRLIVIRDAFVASFAERIYASLDACTAWKIYEDYQTHFHYRHRSLYNESDYPLHLTWCNQIFGSPATKTLAQRLSGRDCCGPTVLSASWYLPGDHQLPHTDAVGHTRRFREPGDTAVISCDIHQTVPEGASIRGRANRQVAFVWHLTKHWKSEWGGAFFWCPKSIYLPPAFNTLILFNVGSESFHFVTEVSPYALGKRLAVNGWWTGPASRGVHGQTEPEQLRGNTNSFQIY